MPVRQCSRLHQVHEYQVRLETHRGAHRIRTVCHRSHHSHTALTLDQDEVAAGEFVAIDHVMFLGKNAGAGSAPASLEWYYA